MRVTPKANKETKHGIINAVHMCSRFVFKFVLDIAGSSVKFDRRGDGLARYDILNYQKLQNGTGYHYKVRRNFSGLGSDSASAYYIFSC